jgi:hypothetical protein
MLVVQCIKYFIIKIQFREKFVSNEIDSLHYLLERGKITHKLSYITTFATEI